MESPFKSVNGKNMDNRQLFIEKLRDLRTRIATPNEYNLIQCSAIIRQFLLDSPSILSEMSKLTGQPISFQTGAVGKVQWAKSITGSYPAIFSVAQSLGASYGHSQLQSLKLKHFLKLDVAVIDGEVYTVYDVINYAAHAAGGVHNYPKSERLKRLSRQEGIYLAGVPLIVQLLVGLGDAVDWACKPIETLVLTSLGSEALAIGEFNYAVECYEEVIRLSEPHRENFSDFWEVFVANLDRARNARAQQPSAIERIE